MVARQRFHLVHLAAVSGQVARAGELAATDVASVWLLSGVHALVVPQAPGPRERRVTLRALVGFEARVGAEVVVEARLLTVAHPADLADVGPLVVVVDKVLLQVVAEGEGLGAPGALEALVLLVAHHVGLDALHFPPAQLAHRALAVLPVHVQLLAVRERGPAHFTQPPFVLRPLPPAPPQPFPPPPRCPKLAVTHPLFLVPGRVRTGLFLRVAAGALRVRVLIGFSFLLLRVVGFHAGIILKSLLRPLSFHRRVRHAHRSELAGSGDAESVPLLPLIRKLLGNVEVLCAGHADAVLGVEVRDDCLA